MLSQEWLDKFNLVQWGLCRVISDNCPTMITNETKDWGPKPFKFINAWLQNPRWLQIIKEVWEAKDIQGKSKVCYHQQIEGSPK